MEEAVAVEAVAVTPVAVEAVTPVAVAVVNRVAGSSKTRGS